jgi:8-oxo-dGTP pyrophosphatase MutT (NUDIX family)
MQTYVTVHAMAVNPEGDVLVLQRAADRSSAGKWNCVTGYLQDRESARDAALRELKEETNLTGSVIRTADPYWVDDREDKRRWLVIPSLIRVDDVASLRIDPRESQDFRWIRPDDSLVEHSRGFQLSRKALGLS